MKALIDFILHWGLSRSYTRLTQGTIHLLWMDDNVPDGRRHGLNAFLTSEDSLVQWRIAQDNSLHTFITLHGNCSRNEGKQPSTLIGPHRLVTATR